jgi:hypothetical protein
VCLFSCRLSPLADTLPRQALAQGSRSRAVTIKTRAERRTVARPGPRAFSGGPRGPRPTSVTCGVGGFRGRPGRRQRIANRPGRAIRQWPDGAPTGLIARHWAEIEAAQDPSDAAPARRVGRRGQASGGVTNLSQRKLARRLGASRTTLRKALNDLAAAGAVMVETGKSGTRLALAG